MSLWDLLLAPLALPLAVACGYLAFLALMARGVSAASPSGAKTEPRWRMDIVVPAHNEASGIAATVESLLAVDYPSSQRRILVVADNCSDDTAECARAAGAEVLVRTDSERRGKGYALELAFTRSAEENKADAVVVVDADTFVSQNLLTAFASRLDRGAQALQASYGVRNPRASWRTRLMTIALALFNDLRSLGRERMGWSAGLRGNGMCFTHATLRAVPHHAYSLVEDLEYGIRLGRAGVRVQYVPEAQVKGEMVSSEKASRSQRRRWENGRRRLAREQAFPLLKDALAQRNGMLLDLSLDLLVPPLSTLAVATFGFLVLTGVVATTSGTPPWASLFLGILSTAALFFYVLRGWALSGVGARGLVDLLWAPVFIGWKLLLRLSPSSRSGSEWVRTQREKESRNHGP